MADELSDDECLAKIADVIAWPDETLVELSRSLNDVEPARQLVEAVYSLQEARHQRPHVGIDRPRYASEQMSIAMNMILVLRDPDAYENGRRVIGQLAARAGVDERAVNRQVLTFAADQLVEYPTRPRGCDDSIVPMGEGWQ